MKKRFMSVIVLVMFASTQTFAQPASRPLPKYTNDLDRAMCVFSKTNKKLDSLTWMTKGGSVFTIGALFLMFRENHFKKSADTVADALMGKFVESNSQKNAFLHLVEKPNYFLTESEANIAELKEAARLLSTIKDHDLPDYLQGLDLVMAKKDAQTIEIYHKEFDKQVSGIKVRYLEQKTKLRQIDDWISHSRPKVKVAIHIEMERNATHFLEKYGMTRAAFLEEIKTLQSKSARYANWSVASLVVGTAALVLSILLTGDKDSIEQTVEKFASWDLVDVRNYFSKADNQTEMQNLAAQANKCGCY